MACSPLPGHYNVNQQTEALREKCSSRMKKKKRETEWNQNRRAFSALCWKLYVHSSGARFLTLTQLSHARVHNNEKDFPYPSLLMLYILSSSSAVTASVLAHATNVNNRVRFVIYYLLISFVNMLLLRRRFSVHAASLWTTHAITLGHGQMWIASGRIMMMMICSSSDMLRSRPNAMNSHGTFYCCVWLISFFTTLNPLWVGLCEQYKYQQPLKHI